MSAAVLLEQLEGIKATGPGRWIARCPAHPDKHPSLAIRELDDGRVLVHDFAGCEVESVLSAVGLTFSDLYPERPTGEHKRERRPFSAVDVLRALSFESLVVAMSASTMARGEALSHEDQERLLVASWRIQAAVRESGHA